MRINTQNPNFMKITLRTLSFLVVLLPLMVSAQAGSYMNNPMVRVVMDTYASLLRENPQDYVTYFNRAKEYYRHGDYNRAMDDLNEAIKYYPREEASDLSQAYTIRGLIYEMWDKDEKALADFNEALILEPNSRYSLISRADLLRDMKRYSEAKEDYQILLRRDVRCQEAYLGLAIIAYKENNIGLCHENLKKAQDANPTNVDFYLTRAGIYEDMGEWRKAADDYVMAMTFGDNRRSVAGINALSAIAYEPVIEALSVAIEKADEKGFYYFIRGAIHMNNQHYSASIKDWNTIIEKNMLHFHTVYYNRGFCYMRLGQFDYAVEDISAAIKMKGDQMAYYITRSKLYRVMGDYESAQADIAVASTFDMTHVDVLLQRAMLAMEQGNPEVALEHYNEALLCSADNASLYLLRGDVYATLQDVDLAVRSYEMMLNVYEEVPTFESCRGFALARLGRMAEAEAWIEQVMQSIKGIPAPEDYYNAACLYTHTDNKAMAYEYLEKALKAGYGDYFNLYFEYDSPTSLATLRNDIEFRELVRNYSEMF